MKIWTKLTSGVYAIAEMSANHAGKLENALEIVRAAKQAGADCLKIQTYTADTMTLNCNNKYFKISGGLWDGYTLYDLYQEASTPWEWHKPIKDECEKLGLDFLSTPFDQTSVDFLEQMDVKFFKIASFELTDIPLIEYTASKGKPLIISCGMGSVDEIRAAIEACRRYGNSQIILLKCTSEYPARYADMNIATLQDMKEKFKVPVGLSDHSMGFLVPVAAVSLGACVIEKHFCLSREIKNPDSAFSMEPHEFKEMKIKLTETAEIIGKVSYDLSESEKASTVFRRSIFVRKDMQKGNVFTEDHLCVIRPGYGINPEHYKEILGTVAKTALKRGNPLKLKDLEDIQFILKLKKAVFESDRLVFTGISEADTFLIVKWRSDEEIIRYFKNPVKITEASHRKWLDRYLDDVTRFDFMIREKDTGRAIGIVGAQNIDYSSSSAEVAYLIGEKDRQGFGFAAEAVTKLEEFLERQLQMIKFSSTIHRNNLPSLRLAEKLYYIKKSDEDEFVILEKNIRAF